MKILTLSLTTILSLTICEISAEVFQLPQLSTIEDAQAYGARRTVVSATGPRGGTVTAARRTVVGGRRLYSLTPFDSFQKCDKHDSGEFASLVECEEWRNSLREAK